MWPKQRGAGFVNQNMRVRILSSALWVSWNHQTERTNRRQRRKRRTTRRSRDSCDRFCSSFSSLASVQNAMPCKCEGRIPVFETGGRGSIPRRGNRKRRMRNGKRGMRNGDRSFISVPRSPFFILRFSFCPWGVGERTRLCEGRGSGSTPDEDIFSWRMLPAFVPTHAAWATR